MDKVFPLADISVAISTRESGQNDNNVVSRQPTISPSRHKKTDKPINQEIVPPHEFSYNIHAFCMKQTPFCRESRSNLSKPSHTFVHTDLGDEY